MATKQTAKKQNNQKGDEATRRKIVEAARKVFSEHPYNSASIRMIGKVGQFEYPLVHYYFKTKADLFETVVKEFCDEIFKANNSFYEGVVELGPKKGLELYLDRYLDYHFTNPHYLRLIMLNFTQDIENNDIPGYHLLTDLVAKSRLTFQEKIPSQADDRTILLLVNSFIILLFAYVGSRSGTAIALGMDPKSEEYKGWVKESLVSTFLPSYEKVFSGTTDTP